MALRSTVPEPAVTQSTAIPDQRSEAKLQAHEARGLFLGFLGVLMFSGSLPFTRVAVRELGVLFPTFGRAVIAGLLGALCLTVTRTPLPGRHLWRNMALVVVGVVIGFPAFTGLALRFAPAGHGSVVIGLLPAATAGWSVLRTGERPSRRFWAYAALGAAAIVVLAVSHGADDVALGDLYLCGAILAAAVGYGEGAVVSREVGGWQTISWAVVFALPVSLVLAVIGLGPVGFDETATAWIAMAYLGGVSMFLGFFAWYAGLALGGVARVSQIQLMQPTFSLVWAAIFLHERIDLLTAAVAGVVLVSVVGSRRSAIVAR
jgi:drug/metabolite transporter (DMT)-like permease